MLLYFIAVFESILCVWKYSVYPRMLVNKMSNTTAVASAPKNYNWLSSCNKCKTGKCDKLFRNINFIKIYFLKAEQKRKRKEKNINRDI